VILLTPDAFAEGLAACLLGNLAATGTTLLQIRGVVARVP
jgi:hypothetical protein